MQMLVEKLLESNKVMAKMKWPFHPPSPRDCRLLRTDCPSCLLAHTYQVQQGACRGPYLR